MAAFVPQLLLFPLPLSLLAPFLVPGELVMEPYPRQASRVYATYSPKETGESRAWRIPCFSYPEDHVAILGNISSSRPLSVWYAKYCADSLVNIVGFSFNASLSARRRPAGASESCRELGARRGESTLCDKFRFQSSYRAVDRVRSGNLTVGRYQSSPLYEERAKDATRDCSSENRLWLSNSPVMQENTYWNAGKLLGIFGGEPGQTKKDGSREQRAPVYILDWASGCGHGLSLLQRYSVGQRAVVGIGIERSPDPARYALEHYSTLRHTCEDSECSRHHKWSLREVDHFLADQRAKDAQQQWRNSSFVHYVQAPMIPDGGFDLSPLASKSFDIAMSYAAVYHFSWPAQCDLVHQFIRVARTYVWIGWNLYEYGKWDRVCFFFERCLEKLRREDPGLLGRAKIALCVPEPCLFGCTPYMSPQATVVVSLS